MFFGFPEEGTDYPGTLLPFLIILAASAAGIILCVFLRRRISGTERIQARASRTGRSGAKDLIPKQKPSVFMILRWGLMIVFSFFMIAGGLLFGLRISSLSIPVLSCPWNREQMAEASCYYLSHLNELFELPLTDILLFFASTLGFTIVLGRIMCGFLCPMGLIQDLMDKLRQKLCMNGFTMNEKHCQAVKPVKWCLLFLFFGLWFAGGNFCNFCPAIPVSPILAGMSTSLYVSGFLMILVLIGSFFKRRMWCLVCPLGYLVGLLHKISLFRIRKDCTACTECGACYEACPMGIKLIYTERENTDVTDVNCIMCGECIRKCPEDNALSMTFAGKQIYTASRAQVMSSYQRNLRKEER